MNRLRRALGTAVLGIAAVAVALWLVRRCVVALWHLLVALALFVAVLAIVAARTLAQLITQVSAEEDSS